MKLGFKPFEGVDRVTLRTNKDMVMYIDKPLVMKANNSDKGYVIFGEPKFLDFKDKMATEQADKFQKGEEIEGGENVEDNKPGDIQEDDQEEEEDDENIDQGDLKDEDIKTLMDYANCSRVKAIKTLKAAKGDVVEAITMVS